MNRSTWHVFSTVLLCIAIAGCDHTTALDPDSSLPDFRSRVVLDNQTNHSGVLVKLLGTNAIAVSNDSGYFDFSLRQIDEPFQDGDYSARIIYPYFSSVDTSITLVNGVIDPPLQIQLEQFVRFWVEPSDTLGVISSDGQLRGYAENLTDQILTYATGGLQKRWAIEPFIREWDESRCAYCRQITDGVQGLPSGIRLDPYETKLIGYFSFSWFDGCSVYLCIAPGAYDVYVGAATGEYQDYFSTRVWSDPHHSALNQSLLKKPELMAPARIFVINR